MPALSSKRFPRPKVLVAAVLVLGLSAFFWPARDLGSDNFVFYFVFGHHILPLESSNGASYLPLLQVLNMMGKVAGIQEKKGSLRVYFGAEQIDLRENEAKIQIDKTSFKLPNPVHVTDGTWMVPVEFLPTILPHLTHQTIEYQEGTSRIFIGDVKPVSFTVHVDPIANGARLAVQFTDKVAVRTASSNGKLVIFLGDRPMEPMETSYHFQNPYVSDLKFDDQDGTPKLILSPTSVGLNFYPTLAENGKVLLADVLKPPSAPVQALGAPGPPSQSTSEGTTAQTGEPGVAAAPPLPIVALDAGHGGDDNGARSHDGVLEKDLVTQYVARVRTALLATAKYRVVLTRTGDVNLTSDQRALAVNTVNAIYFLSFHAGDLGTASPRISVFTFQPPTAPTPSSDPSAGDAANATFIPWEQVQQGRLEQSLQLALFLQQQFAQLNGVAVDLPSSAPVRTLRSVNAPAVAIEIGRLASDADATELTNPDFQKQVAAAVVQALAGFEKGEPGP